MTQASSPLDALRFTSVRQHLHASPIADLPPAIEAALAVGGPWHAGQRIAIAVGSRGIDRLAEVVRGTVATLRAAGAEPFIVPAMGSHGGATAAGQAEVLAGYGVTETAVGAPVISSMDTVLLGNGLPVQGGRASFDQQAAASDGIVVINRVKPHSFLTGAIGSGLLKMTAVGLGKHAGAKALHDAGLEDQILPTAQTLLGAAPIRAGIALVEDALDQLSIVEGVPPADFAATDRRLLTTARDTMPTIPFDPLDAAIFVWMGKDLSGAGMDPNVVGMHRRLGGPPQRQISTLTALRLTPASHGNAVGIGMADLIPASLASTVDAVATRANAETSGWTAGAHIPITLATDAAVIARACAGDVSAIRVLIAQDTAHLDHFLISPALLPEVQAHSDLEIAGPATPLRFDREGRLLTPPR